MMKKILIFILSILFIHQLHSQSIVKTYAWMCTEVDTCMNIVRIYENDTTFMEIGLFYEFDTAWYKIRNGKWYMKNHERDSFALFFDKSFVRGKTKASWSYRVSPEYNAIISYCWKKERKRYHGHQIYCLFYEDVLYNPPKITTYPRDDGTVKKVTIDTSVHYVHPPIFYYFTCELGIFGLYSDISVIRQGIDVVLP